MTLETLSHISGILGFLAVIFTVFITYRKKLLRTGFEEETKYKYIKQ